MNKLEKDASCMSHDMKLLQLLTCEMVSGPEAGEMVFLCRIPRESSCLAEPSLTYTRLQFPVRHVSS